MQKVHYSLSSNSLYIKFQDLLNSQKIDYFSPLVHTTIHYRCQICLALEIEFPIFNRIITFSGLLRIYTQHTSIIRLKIRV